MNSRHIDECKDGDRQLFSSIREALLITDNESNIVDVNPAFTMLFGFTLDEIVGRKISFITAHHHQFTDFDKSLETSSGHGSFVYEADCRKKNGEIFSGEVAVSLYTDNKGERIGYIDLIKDITERELIENKLIHVMKAVESTSDAIGMSDVEGHHFYQNKAYTDLFGYATPGELEAVGGGAATVKDPQIAFDIFDNIMHGRSWAGELELVKKDGTVFPAFERADAIKDNDGNIIGLIGIISDITERKKAEEALLYFQMAVASSTDAIGMSTPEGRHYYQNKAYTKLFGLSVSEVDGVSGPPSTVYADEEEGKRIFDIIMRGGAFEGEAKMLDKDRNVKDIYLRAYSIKNNKGEVVGLVGVHNDMTEKHLLEEERLKIQKLEAVGTLAGGIAHDFNNLLQGVFGYISMAKLNLDRRRESLEMLEQAEKALHMSVNLTTQLLTFSKGGKPVRKRMKLPPVIENAVKFTLSGSRVDYKFEADKALWPVEADEGQIGQVIQNIILNAEQAMPMGGTVKISASNFPAAQEGIPAVLSRGDYVVISVEDGGIGIPAEYMPKIFDPYFTTKDKGSGLGLATSYSIIKNHGGTIEVRSEMGRGSTFLVWLPAIEAVAEKADSVEVSGSAVRKGRVLLMDDEEIVRNIAGAMIKSLGHEVELAENGEEAITKYQEALSQGRRFDVVILDLTIRGGMGGETAIKSLLTLDPDIRAIVSSGYADSSAISEYQDLGFRACLTKPYSIEKLNSTLNSILD